MNPCRNRIPSSGRQPSPGHSASASASRSGSGSGGARARAHADADPGAGAGAGARPTLEASRNTTVEPLTRSQTLHLKGKAESHCQSTMPVHGRTPATRPSLELQADLPARVEPPTQAQEHDMRVHGRNPATGPGVQREASGNTRVEPSFRSRNPSRKLNLNRTRNRRCPPPDTAPATLRAWRPTQHSNSGQRPSPQLPNTQLALHVPLSHNSLQPPHTRTNQRPCLTNAPLSSPFPSHLIVLQVHPPASTSFGLHLSPDSAQHNA